MIALLRELHAEGGLTPPQAALLARRRPSEELYDTWVDPYETVNLANSPGHQDVLKRLRETLEAWIEEAGDQGRTAEAPEIIERLADLRKQE